MNAAPSPAEREALFRGFARALFKADMAALYTVVAPDFAWRFHDGAGVVKHLLGAAAIAAHLAEQHRLFSTQHFHQVAYHHLPELSFMTFRVSETLHTGGQREQAGIERYSFRNGLIAEKDVYRKPMAD